jgi:hypothetical protein
VKSLCSQLWVISSGPSLVLCFLLLCFVFNQLLEERKTTTKNNFSRDPWSTKTWRLLQSISRQEHVVGGFVSLFVCRLVGLFACLFVCLFVCLFEREAERSEKRERRAQRKREREREREREHRETKQEHKRNRNKINENETN